MIYRCPPPQQQEQELEQRENPPHRRSRFGGYHPPETLPYICGITECDLLLNFRCVEAILEMGPRCCGSFTLTAEAIETGQQELLAAFVAQLFLTFPKMVPESNSRMSRQTTATSTTWLFQDGVVCEIPTTRYSPEDLDPIFTYTWIYTCTYKLE